MSLDRQGPGSQRCQRSWTDLGFLLLCKVIFDVEGLPDLLGGLSFDHVGHRLTGDVQQAFNVQVIGRLKDKSKGRGPEIAARALRILAARYFGGNSAHTRAKESFYILSSSHQMSQHRSSNRLSCLVLNQMDIRTAWLGFRCLGVNSSSSVCCFISPVFWSLLRCLFTPRHHVKPKKRGYK